MTKTDKKKANSVVEKEEDRGAGGQHLPNILHICTDMCVWGGLDHRTPASVLNKIIEYATRIEYRSSKSLVRIWVEGVGAPHSKMSDNKPQIRSAQHIQADASTRPSSSTAPSGTATTSSTPRGRCSRECTASPQRIVTYKAVDYVLYYY